MKAALGVLSWPPDVFWNSTPHEFWAAWEGWNMAQGNNLDDDEDQLDGSAMDSDDRQYLIAWMAREKRNEDAGVVTLQKPEQKLTPAALAGFLAE